MLVLPLSNLCYQKLLVMFPINDFNKVDLADPVWQKNGRPLESQGIKTLSLTPKSNHG